MLIPRPSRRPHVLGGLLGVALLSMAGAARAADDGGWLEHAAEQAVIAGDYPRAIALLRGLAALRPRDPSPVYRLGEVYSLAHRYEEAIEAYRRFAGRPEADNVRKQRAESEASRLEEAPPADELFRPAVATAEARRLFEVGKSDADARRYEAAVVELQAALLLDPDLPGPYRLLGAIYGKTGDRAQERLFLADYLRVRPDGRIADTVREVLQKDDLLGSIAVDASYPCQVYVNGRDIGRRTPLKGYPLPAGRYLVDLENKEYHLDGRVRLDVEVGKQTEKKYNFGVLEMKLDPWARVRIDGKDVGLFDEVGVPEGKHTVYYRSHDGTKEKTVLVEIKGGAKEKLSW